MKAGHNKVVKESISGLKLAIVVWVDSMFQHGWGKYDQDVSNVCVSAGHIVYNLEDTVVLALNKNEYEHGNYVSIPRVAILKMLPWVP